MKYLIFAGFLCLAALRTTAQPCTPLGDQTSFGTSDVWIGYVYDDLNLATYHGYINEGSIGNPNFDQSFGGDNVSYPTNGCPVQTETFSVRYKLRKTFSNATYDFIVGADDGYRLSLDGGLTWVINRWNDQGYTTSSYSATLNGSYDLVLEYYENGGGNRVSFNVTVGCIGTENTAIYGTGDIWNGYVYDGINFNSYKGMVHQGVLGNTSFDQDFGGANTPYTTSACPVQTENFSVRYRLRQNFTAGNYTFIVGGDDGYRLSFDGGATWVIDRWFDQSYNSASYTTNLTGNYDMVLEFYENGGDNRVSFNMQPNLILPIRLLYFTANKSGTSISLDWQTSADGDPAGFVIQRSSSGVNFQDIKELAASAGIASAQGLRFHSDDAAQGTDAYYRLKMTDREGHITYSKTVLVKTAVGSEKVSVFPTVVSAGRLYCMAQKNIRAAVVTIFDLNGRRLESQALGNIRTGETRAFDLLQMGRTPGVYILRLSDGDQFILQQKIIL